MKPQQKYTIGEYVTIQGWSGTATGTVTAIDWVYHHRLEMWVWGYMIDFDEGCTSPFTMRFIPEGYLRKNPTNTNRFIYVAAPYSDDNDSVVEWRVEEFLKFDNKLCAAGYLTMSPLSKHFCLNKGHKIDGTYNFWGRYSREMLARCDCVFVLMLPGWARSIGVQDEVKLAKELNKPVYYFHSLFAFPPVTEVGDLADPSTVKLFV